MQLRVDGRDGFLREQAGIVDQETVRNAASAVLKSLLQVLQPHAHQIKQVSRESVGVSGLVREVETVFPPCTVEERYRTVSKQVQELVAGIVAEVVTLIYKQLRIEPGVCRMARSAHEPDCHVQYFFGLSERRV